jgi:TrkA family protein
VAVVLLLLIMVVSAMVVRVAAFMLELTGLPWEQAKFQALSAFTNSGFSTRESEEVMTHPMRRRIVSWLMVAGNAGIVTTMGTFAGSVVQTDLRKTLQNVGIILLGGLLLYAISRWRGLMQRMRTGIEGWLKRRYDWQPPRAEDLLRLGTGYSLTRIELADGSPVIDKEIRELQLPSWMVQILAIERGDVFRPVPRANDRLMAGDALVVYGAEDAIHKVFRPRTTTRLSILGSPPA